MNAIEKACYEMDLSKPIWLDNIVKDFQIHSKCRFNKDAFVEQIEFLRKGLCGSDKLERQA